MDVMNEQLKSYTLLITNNLDYIMKVIANL